MKATTLILIRHGETYTNVKNVLHRYGDEAILTKTGIDQITATGFKLKSLGIKKLVASNEKRAIESAELIAEICNTELSIVDGLEDRNWGDLSGNPWSDIKVILDPMSLDARYNYIPPKGESWKSFENRLAKSVKKVIDDYKGLVVGIVTHGGSIRALMPYLLNIPKDQSFKFDPKNASISMFNIKNGNITLITVNNISHLSL